MISVLHLSIHRHINERLRKNFPHLIQYSIHFLLPLLLSCPLRLPELPVVKSYNSKGDECPRN
jgi:hypothetical protein